MERTEGDEEMSRLIDADALSKDFDKRCCGECCCCSESTNTESGCKVIDEQPTIDAVPTVHGHWIKIGGQYSIRNMKCSICGEEVFGDVDTEKYCFNCGAKMDEVMV